MRRAGRREMSRRGPVFWACVTLAVFAGAAEQKREKAWLGPGELVEVGRVRVEELAERAARTPGLAATLKPGFHLTPPRGWMNDPNAPLEYPTGTFHLFYQFNPLGAVWGAPYWAHVVSSDLVHWRQLPDALVPDMTYDSDGVFSGSATMLNNGTPAITYTGVSRFSELGYFYQVQALALPADPADPLLRKWNKRPAPVLPRAPPRGNHAQWRDPSTAVWAPSGHALGSPGNSTSSGSYFMTVAAQLDCQGAAALYEAGPEFDSWEYRSILTSVAALGRGGGGGSASGGGGGDGGRACVPVPGAPEAGEDDAVECPTASQFSACPMWECTDFVELGGGISMFKFSDQVEGRSPFGQDWYVLSDSPVDFASVAGRHPRPGNAALFNNSVGGAGFAPLLMDHGAVYASKAFRTSDSRVVWWGWVYETSAGCDRMCGDGTPFTEALGWQGAQTIPREITYDPESRSLLLNPVREAAKLRTRQIFNGDLAIDGTGQAAVLVSSEQAPAGVEPRRQLELLAHFTLSSSFSALPPLEARQASSVPFMLRGALDLGHGSRVEASLGGTASRGKGGQLVVGRAEVWVDTSLAGGATPAAVWGGEVPLPQGGLAAGALELRMLVDRSVVEVFVLGGRQRTTVRVYPLDPLASWGLALSAHVPGGAVRASAQVWELGSCWTGGD